MVREPQRRRGVSFRHQLSELIADHSSEVEADEVSQSLQELSHALDEEGESPTLGKPSSSFERELNDLVQRHADLADDWARLTRTLADLADDLELAGSRSDTLSTETTYRRTDDGHVLSVTYPAPFLMLRAIDTLAEVGGLVLAGRTSIPILSEVDLRITCRGISEQVNLTARIVQQKDNALSLDVDLQTEAVAIERLRELAADAAPAQDRDSAPQHIPPGSRAPKTPGTTHSPFDEGDASESIHRQPPAGQSPGAAIVRPPNTPTHLDRESVGVGNGDRKTRRGRRLLDALTSLHYRTQADNLFDVLGLDWDANGANVRDAHRDILDLIEEIAALPLTKDERRRLKKVQHRIQRAAKILRHSSSRREYRASQIDTDRFLARIVELETRLAARVLRDDHAGARRACAQILELDPTHPNARHHKQRLS